MPASNRIKTFFQRWLICTMAVLVAAYLVPGVRYEKPLDLVMASLLLGILNAVLRPLLLLLALPLLLVTLGLFTLIINALLLNFVGFLLRPHFFVEDFWAAFWGALVISVVTVILNTLTGTGGGQVTVHRQRKRRPPRDDGNGSVIDV